MSALDLEALLRTLTEDGIRFVVIGGAAVVAHGVLRTTEDLDIVPSPDSENLRALGNTLARLGGQLTNAPDRDFGPDERAALAQGRSLSVSTAVGDLDIVQRLPGTPGYETLESAAIEVDAFGIALRVCSLEHLKAMKRARGSAQDLADLEALEAGEAS